MGSCRRHCWRGGRTEVDGTVRDTQTLTYISQLVRMIKIRNEITVN